MTTPIVIWQTWNKMYSDHWIFSKSFSNFCHCNHYTANATSSNHGCQLTRNHFFISRIENWLRDRCGYIKCHLGANSGHNSKLHQQSESGNFGNYRSKFNYSKLCQNFWLPILTIFRILKQGFNGIYKQMMFFSKHSKLTTISMMSLRLNSIKASWMVLKVWILILMWLHSWTNLMSILWLRYRNICM